MGWGGEPHGLLKGSLVNGLCDFSLKAENPKAAVITVTPVAIVIAPVQAAAEAEPVIVVEAKTAAASGAQSEAASETPR